MLNATCPPGYFGLNCTWNCPLNTFGENCGGRCIPRCFAKDCHHVYGCQNIDQTTKTGKKNIDRIENISFCEDITTAGERLENAHLHVVYTKHFNLPLIGCLKYDMKVSSLYDLSF